MSTSEPVRLLLGPAHRSAAGQPAAEAQPRALPLPAVPAVPEVDLMALFGTLWRGKWWIFLGALLFMLLGGFYGFRLAVPLYASSARIALESQEQQFMGDIESVLGGGGPDTATINTESEVLRSRRLVGALVDQLGLVSDPEFNEALRGEGAISRALSGLTGWISGVAEDAGRSETGAIREVGEGLGYLAEALDGSAEAEVVDQTAMRDEVIDAVLDVISVANVRQSLVFVISVTTTDPRKSADIANALAALYIQQALDVKFEANEQASTFLSERAAELQQELEQLETELAAFRDGTDLVSVERLAAQDRLLKEQRDRIRELQADREDLRLRAERYATLAARGDYAELAALSEDPRLARAVARGPGADPAPIANAIVSRTEAELSRLEAQLSALGPSVKELTASIAQLTEDLLTLQQYEREISATRLLYENFLTRLKETDVQKGLQQPDARILSDAIPRPAVAPRRMLILLLSAIVGVGAASGLVLLHEMRTSNFRTPDQLETATGNTVLGTIPLIPGGKRVKTLKYLRDKPTSLAAEAIRNLRTSLLMSSFDRAPKVIAVTSSIPGEGKTTVSLALAQNMASLDARVLLIEADIRRRTFAEYFDMSHALTLTEAMSDPDRLQPGTFVNEELGVDMLGGAKVKLNAADLFSSESFANLLAVARERYDHIVIDTPPVLAVPDARIIGRHIDAMVYVVRWNHTTRSQVRQGTAMLTSVGVPLAGYALSQVDGRKMKKYGHAGEYGYDGKASKYYDS